MEEALIGSIDDRDSAKTTDFRVYARPRVEVDPRRLNLARGRGRAMSLLNLLTDADVIY